MAAVNWSQYIEADLQQRLSARQPLPCEPTLQHLAAHYGVSTRPIRTALQRLEARGLWSREKRPRGRGRSWTPLSNNPRRQSIRRQQTRISPPTDFHAVIAREVIQRSLEGNETFIRETAMAEHLGISTTIVREAFLRLAGQGILQHVPRRGWRLRPLCHKDLEDFAAIRQTLECMALRLSWEKLQSSAGRARVEAFLAGNRPATADRPASVDDDFHAWIIEQSGNRYLNDFFKQYGHYYRFIFAWEGTDPQAAAQTVRQHRRILKAIAAGDMHRAQTALKAHLHYEHPRLRQVMSSIQPLPQESVS